VIRLLIRIACIGAFLFSAFMLGFAFVVAKEMKHALNGAASVPWDLLAEGSFPMVLLMCGSVIVFVLSLRKQQADSARGFPVAAAQKSGQLAWTLTTGTFGGLFHLFQGQDTHQISSSVGIVRDTAAAYRQSLQDFFFFLGYISLALALLNLLPILPLDGGHIVMSILERVRGRAFSQLAYLRYSTIGIALFLFLLYFGLRNDLGGS